MTFTLAGSTMKDPNGFYPMRTRVELADRAGDGSLVVDVKAVKMTYTITYHDLTAAELLVFTTLYSSGSFITFTYPEGGSTQTKTVRIASMSAGLVYYISTTEYWENVRITLVEQ